MNDSFANMAFCETIFVYWALYMNSIMSAVDRYQRAVAVCIDVANDALSRHAEIKLTLDQFNDQVMNLRAGVLNASLAQAKPYGLYEYMRELETQSDQLSALVESAKVIAVGRLGEVFDGLRSASERMHKLLPDEMDAVVPAITKCHEDISGICSRLIQCCVVDAQTLEAMGISNLLRLHPPR